MADQSTLERISQQPLPTSELQQSVYKQGTSTIVVTDGEDEVAFEITDEGDDITQEFASSMKRSALPIRSSPTGEGREFHVPTDHAEALLQAISNWLHTR